MLPLCYAAPLPLDMHYLATYGLDTKNIFSELSKNPFLFAMGKSFDFQTAFSIFSRTCRLALSPEIE